MATVTVLMPVYNADRYLGPAIESILRQTFKEFEFLIINDASTDSSSKIIASFSDKRIRVVDNERNLGVTKTLNRGIHLAEGELIARQDADDLSHPERLERQVVFLRAHPEIALVGTQAIIIDELGNYKRILRDRPHDHVAIKWDLLFDNSFVHTSVMFRNTIVRDTLGGYDPSYVACEDYELWSRVAEVCHVANLPSSLVWHRVHAASKREGTEESVKVHDLARVIRRNAGATFGKEFLSESESHLLAQLSFGYRDRSSAAKFVELFDRLVAEYLRICPEAVISRDFKQAVNGIYFRLFYNAWKKKVFPPAWCFVRQPGWIRIASMLLFSHCMRSISMKNRAFMSAGTGTS
jgi:glycosyltransferase involved in cell wall biosynthesis